MSTGDIVHLNVGGHRFSTSRQTLTVVPDTFFTALLSGRIPTLKDETEALFIDRDPRLFSYILNYLRNRSVSLHPNALSWKRTDSNFPGNEEMGGLSEEILHEIRNEAEYYGISPLVKQLTLCCELNDSGCGDVLFYAFLSPPLIPARENKSSVRSSIKPPARPPPPNPLQQSGATSISVTDLRSVLPTNHHPHWTDPLRVQIVKAHLNSIAVAYPHFVACFKQKETVGFQLAFTSPYFDEPIERVAINAKMGSVGMATSGGANGEPATIMIAVSFGQKVRAMLFSESGHRIDVGTFDLNVAVDSLFFIGTQLVALSPTGKIGVWNSMTQHWQSQELLAPITSYDTAGSFLLLGSSNGTINYIDMQKFPLRMKDNDLLVTELYRDPSSNQGAPDSITSIGVYLTPKTSICGNWIEIAYGTSSGTVRVIVQHPETVGQGPQLFQTFTVHRSPVTKVKLSEKFLVSVCADNHVRTWGVTRFRGMISTQPGSTSVSSFKITSLEEMEPTLSSIAGNHFGPFGEQDDEQVFVQKVVPEMDCLFVRTAANGQRVCVIKSVDGTTITSFCVHECEGSSRIGARPRRFVITGHASGAVQMWDLTTALDFFNKGEPTVHQAGGPTARELVRLLDHCDLTNSRPATPCISPSPSLYPQMTPTNRQSIVVRAALLTAGQSQVGESAEV